MPFPESDRVVFGQNTLDEVICQLRFPPILEISSGEPAPFQSRIRAGYPLYEREDGPHLPETVRRALSGLAAVPETLTHKFYSEDRGRSIALHREFVAVTESSYERWEVFSEEVERALTAAVELYAPTFFSRIGLRYRNVIDPQALGIEEVSWTDLLKPELLGLLGADFLDDNVVSTKAETRIKFPDDDAAFVTLRQGLGENDDGGSIYIIDADFFSTGRFDTDHVRPVLDEFNRAVGNLFRWAISDQLRTILDPRPLE